MSPTPDSFPRPESSEERRAGLGSELQAALGAQYVVEDRLGEGGFAVVFLVRDLSLGRRLAVKVLAPDMALSRTGLERFHREAEAIARLSHPNIVPLHFAGQRGELVYLAMAFIDGETLADRIAREPGGLPVQEAASILREVASALDLAHRQGIVHRDVKPANILLERETGRALVSDFGVARVSFGEKSGALTTTGLVPGTPYYFSPEQVTGLASDARSDLYSLGLVAYEMLTGSLPGGGEVTKESLIKRVTEKPEPLRKRRPDVPAVLEDVVMRCLEPDADERFQTGGDIIRALEGEAVPLSGGRRPSPPAGRRRLWIGAAALGLVALAAGTWALTRPPAPPLGPVVPEGMVVIPAGTYLIGSDEADSNSRPAHQVALPAFVIDRTEVTVGAYRRFVGATNSESPWRVEPDSLLPVTGARWAEAAAFCAWRTPGGRLPTEFEWEAAARGLEGRRYAWGNVFDTAAAEVGRPDAKGPVRVGSHSRGNTPLGVSDLMGNVWEWTSSRLLPYPGGVAWPGGDTMYVIRGGAFSLPISASTAFYRGATAPSPATRREIALTGFRCAASLPQPAAQ